MALRAVAAATVLAMVLSTGSTAAVSQRGAWQPEEYDRWASLADPTFPLQYLFNTLPPNDPTSGRIMSFTSLGDIVNSIVMERASGHPFGEIRYFIITANAATDQAVRLALQAQGVPDSHIFTERIPPEDALGPVGPLGLDEDAIDFVTTIRFAVPEDPEAAQAWRTDLPLTVYATYVGLSANDASMMAGVANVLDSDVTDSDGNIIINGLQGSADVYQGSVGDTDKLFVHYFTKDCAVLEDVPGGVESCSPTDGVEPAIGDPLLRGEFIIALRNYIAVGTQRGADPDRLVTPRLLTFTQSTP